jgi:ribosomal protein S12 methylthiotransferase accessory factor YcaO
VDNAGIAASARRADSTVVACAIPGSLQSTVQSPTKEREDQAEDNANEEAGDDRKIESGIAAFDADVAGQTAQPASSETTPERETKDRDYAAEESE